MVLRLYNTAACRVEDFVPREAGKVRMYHCGPTVYASPHIGNFRSFLVADLLRRHLEASGYEVLQVMNITDVGHLTEDDVERGEDKMMAASAREALDPREIARKYEREFLEAVDFLRMRRAHEYPRATEHIAEMCAMIERLLESGYAYRAGGNVYFDQSRFERFGELSGKVVADLVAGHRVGVVEEKRDPRDFALWKTDAKHLMQWDAPWGRGFPGWHIECSAMSMKYLGEQFDLHTGGFDNLFPHHECEVAQSEAFSGRVPFVRYWIHGGWLLVEGAKMAKSRGNFYTVADLAEQGWTGTEVRLALARVHYRSPLNFTFDGLGDARKALDRVRSCRARLLRIAAGGAGTDSVADELDRAERAVVAALDDDLNVSGALAALLALVTELNKRSPDPVGARAALELFARLDERCGFVGDEPRAEEDDGGVAWGGRAADPRRAEIVALAREREAAREARDFERADGLREEIRAAGYACVDTAAGVRIEPARA